MSEVDRLGVIDIAGEWVSKEREVGCEGEWVNFHAESKAVNFILNVLMSDC